MVNFGEKQTQSVLNWKVEDNDAWFSKYFYRNRKLNGVAIIAKTVKQQKCQGYSWEQIQS